MKPFTVNLFTYGNSRDVNTWSNIPYYFERSLLARGVRVNAINIAPPETTALRQLARALNVRRRVASLFGADFASDIYRTKLNYRLTNHQVRSGALRHDDADLNLFLTFSFSSHAQAPVPVVLYCDRTYEHHLEDRGRVPGWRDRAFIRVERDNIQHAALVLTTSEVCRDFIRSRYKTDRVVHLRAGLNVDAGERDPESLIACKERSTNILFIGRGAHKRGVDILIKAFSIFNQRHNGRFALHIVGVRPQELPTELQEPRQDVSFYDYLDRTVPDEHDLYNRLMRSARLFVFPMRPGPVAGVLREAQLNCTPIVVSNVPGTAERVAHDYNGVIVDNLAPEAFAKQMDALVTDAPRWRRLAFNAHASVKDWTWAKTAENFLDVVRSQGLIREALIRR
jgi:glycosyltransferase involved in cell wall biosynthesis